MTSTITTISERLRRALDALVIDSAGPSVTVGDETITDENPIRFRQSLGGALYRHWHSGSGARTDERDLRRDHRFEDLLREATPHRTSKTAAVVKSAVLDTPFGRHVLFDVGRVRVQIPESEGPNPLPPIGTRTTLELPAIRPALSPGFYLVNGSAGGPAGGSHILRVYLHIDEPSMAPAVWQAVLVELESQSASYRAKVLAKANGYPRRDAIVVYLGRESWSAVEGIVTAVRRLPGLNAEYSVLAEPIAEGVAFAWEPMDSRVGWDRMSFGQHRTAVISGAICAHITDGLDLDTGIIDALIEANVDPSAPHRNSDSPDWPPSIAEATP